MPDQRPDEPEFDWLYGAEQASKPASNRPADPPEHTQVLRRTDEPAPPPAVPPRKKIAPPPGEPRKRRRIPYGRIALLLVVAWIAFLIAVPVVAWNKVVEIDATPNGDRPAEQPGTTYLLVGSDSRMGLSKA